MPLLVLSILVSVFCGDKGRTLIFNFWSGAVRAAFYLVELALRLLCNFAKKRKGKEEK